MTSDATSDAGLALTLLLNFSVLSLFAVGGGNSALPEMHRLTVETQHWLNDRQFTELVAIAQAAPGPNVMVVALLGHYVAGIPGAVAASLGMCGPTCVLAHYVSKTFHKFREARWSIAVRSGLVPIMMGLVAASALIITRGADQEASAFLVTGATFALTYFTRVTPLVALATAAIAGYIGLL